MSVVSHPPPFAFRLSTDAAPRRVLTSFAVVAALTLAGGLPVLAVAAHVFGFADLHDIAVLAVLPVAIVAFTVRGTRESVWAAHGLIAGMLATAAYDLLRIPSALTEVWPDFIPRLGGWLLDSPGENVLVGYLWRYIGDGGGIGLVFFLLCGILGADRIAKRASTAVLLGVGYGIFVWSGLMATIMFSAAGPALLFALTFPCVTLSFVGHLIFGSVLGLCYAAFHHGGWNLGRMRKRSRDLT